MSAIRKIAIVGADPGGLTPANILRLLFMISTPRGMNAIKAAHLICIQKMGSSHSAKPVSGANSSSMPGLKQTYGKASGTLAKFFGATMAVPIK